MVKFDLPYEYCRAFVTLRRSACLDWDKEKFERFKRLHREYCMNGYSDDPKWDEYDGMIDEIYNAGEAYVRSDDFEIINNGELCIEPSLMTYINDEPHSRHDNFHLGN